MATAKITGERIVSAERGFNPAWQRHVSAYAFAAQRLGPGLVLDLGCGVGHSHHLLAPRETVGVDVDPDALAGQDRRTVVADMRRLPFADSSFASVLSSHSVEHVPDPEAVVAEAARVLEDDGAALFVTPNRLTFGRPDEIIDPYHFVEFDPRQLAALCRTAFAEVEVFGVFGSPTYMELHDAERVQLDRILGLDPLHLRRAVPLRAKQFAYDFLLRHYRREEDPRAAAITLEDFRWSAEDLDAALDLCAVCTGPRRA